MSEPVITVVGGTGFIGQALVRRLLHAGYRVRTVSRRVQPPISHPNLTHLSAAVSDTAAMRTAVSRAAVVCHLATGGGDRWGDYQRECVDGTRSLAEACLESGVGRFVYVSSVAALYLGGRRSVDGRQPVDAKRWKRSAYSRAKIEAESGLWHLHATRSLPLVIVRPGVVVGRGGSLTHSAFGLWQSETCCIGWGSGRTPLPLVLVDDVADALVAACSTPAIEGRAFNLAGDVRLSAVDFVGQLGRYARRRYEFHPRPLIWLQAVDVAKWVVKGLARKPENPFPAFRHLRSASMRAPIDATEAKSVLGWRPVADRRRFIAEAIVANVPAVPDGDLRVADLS